MTNFGTTTTGLLGSRAAPKAQIMKLIDLMTMASLLLVHIASAQIAGGGDMSTVVPLPYHVAFGVLCLSTLWAIYSANAKQPAKPLAVTTTVVNSCSLAVDRSIPEKSVDLTSSGLMNTSRLIRARCREGTVWRVEADKSTSEGVMKSVDHSGSGPIIRLMINF
jgi:hypothetical protein